MFTGIIEQVGLFQYRCANGTEHKVGIKAARILDNPVIGESIAINGCCLSLEKVDKDLLVFHTLNETLEYTNLKELKPGSPVNLERAMTLNSRVGGHLVSGHVDRAVRVLNRRSVGGDTVLTVELPADLAELLVLKGSVAVDGVSLTVAELGTGSFGVHLIPLTLQDTALTARKRGDLVNLECDLTGKYLLRQQQLRSENQHKKSSINMEMLQEAGFFE